MPVFSEIGIRACVYLALAALCFGTGWKVNGWRLGEGIAQEQAETVKIVRIEEHRQQAVADTEGAKGNAELDAAQRAAAAAERDASGLRGQVRQLATGLATCNAGAAGERQARAATASLLADVYAEADRAAGEYAAEADRARVAGLTCERVHDGIRANGSRGD